MPLPFDRYRELIRRETDLAQQAFELVEPSDPVPTCPGWPASELRDHMTGVLVFWNRQLELADPDAGEPDFPPEVRDRYKLPLTEVAGQIDSALTAAGPELPCWNWSGQNLVSGWIARRMANEMAVHRVDMQLVQGLNDAGHASVTPIPDDLAADGIDELIDVFAAPDPGDVVEPNSVLILDAPDRQWRIAVDAVLGVQRLDDRPAALHHASGAAAEATWSGRPDQILLHLWGRPGEVRLAGDASILDIWRRLPVFR